MNQQLHVNTEESIKQGMIAIRGVINSHVDDYKAMFRADIGNVAFYWGKEGDATRRFMGGHGLSKIIAEKGDDVIADIVKTVARGRIARRYGASLAPRMTIEYQGQTAILARIATGKDSLPDTWLLAEWLDRGEEINQPEPSELPFADVVPEKITEHIFPGNEPTDVTSIQENALVLEVAGKYEPPALTDSRFTRAGNRPNDFIAVAGQRDWWVLPILQRKDLSKLFPPLPIRLTNGQHFGANNGFGLAHIVKSHPEIAKQGIAPEMFVYSLLHNVSKIWNPNRENKLILQSVGRPSGTIFIQLREEKGFYSIVTVFDGKKEGDLVWSGRTADMDLSPIPNQIHESAATAKQSACLSSRTAQGQKTFIPPIPPLEGLEVQTIFLALNIPPPSSEVNPVNKIFEAAITGDWHALKGIFEKPKPEYIPGMFLESAGYDNNSPDLHLKLILNAFRTYAAPYLMEKYKWTQRDIDDYINNPENTLKVFDNMTREAKKYWADQGVDPGKIVEHPITPEKKMLMDEYWPLVSEEYPFAGKTRAEFDETVQWWRDEKIQQAINSRKAKGTKIVDSEAALLAAKSFEDIFTVFKLAFRNVDDGRFAKLEESVDKVTAAYSLLKSGVTDPESRYFAFKQMDMFGNANALTAAGLDKAAILAEFGEENQNKAKILFEGYSSKGRAVIDGLGIGEALARQTEITGQITDAEAQSKQAYDEVKAPYEAREAEASRQYISPLLDEMQRHHDDQNELMRKFAAEKPYPQLPEWELDQGEMEERRRWEKEREQAAYDYNIRTTQLAERIREANKAHIGPIQTEKWAVVEAVAKPYSEKLNSLNEAKKQNAIDLHSKVISHLLEQSSVTKEQAADWIKQNALMDKKAIAKARKAGYAPEDAQKDLAEFYRITNGRLSRLEYTTIKQSRSAAAHWSGKLYVGSSFGKRTFFHELAHLLEEDPKIVETAREFLAKRRESSTVYSLSSLTGNRGYKRDEGAYKDAWHDPYVGKVYSNATEVISMGMQMLSSPNALLSLQEKDPEHLALMLGMCASKPAVDQGLIQVKQGDIQQKKQVAQKTDDVFNDLDKKISKAGDFWTGHINSIDAYTKYGGKKPSQWTVYIPNGEGNYNYSYRFKSEKSMKRALYLWIANGKQGNGIFAMDQLKYALQYGNMTVGEQGLKTLVDTLSGSPVPDIT